MYLLCFKVYKEDLPQLKQQSKEKNHAVPFLKREKAPEDSLKLQFIHGWVACHQPYHQAKEVPFSLYFPTSDWLFFCSLHLLVIILCPVFSVDILWPSQCIQIFRTSYTSMMHIFLWLIFISLYSLHHLCFLYSHNSCSILLGSNQDNIFFLLT